MSSGDNFPSLLNPVSRATLPRNDGFRCSFWLTASHEAFRSSSRDSAARKDYIDLDALITKGRIDLPLALSAAQAIYGPSFNPQITLKALSYFDDGNLRQLSDDTKLRLVTAARHVDLDHLPSLEDSNRNIA